MVAQDMVGIQWLVAMYGGSVVGVRVAMHGGLVVVVWVAMHGGSVHGWDSVVGGNNYMHRAVQIIGM